MTAAFRIPAARCARGDRVDCARQRERARGTPDACSVRSLVWGGGKCPHERSHHGHRTISAFRTRVNDYYKSLNLPPQEPLLLQKEDIAVDDYSEVNVQLINDLAALEPFGNGNPEPIIKISNVLITGSRRMGADAQHVKLETKDTLGNMLHMLAFNAEPHWFLEPGEYANIWFQPTINEWQGNRTVEGRVCNVELAN